MKYVSRPVGKVSTGRRGARRPCNGLERDAPATWNVWAGKEADQFEEFFMAWVPFPSKVAGMPADSYVTEMRWWSLEEMNAAGEHFVPQGAVKLRGNRSPVAGFFR